MKLAAQMYTVKEFTKTPEDIEKSLGKIKAMGYDAIQISAFGAHDANRLKSVLDGLGLYACATHTPFDEIINDTDRVIERHKLLGIPYIGLGYYRMTTADECDRFCEIIRPAAEKIRKSGLKFLYHNHAHDLLKDGGEFLIDRFIKNFAPDTVGLLVDLYWLQYAGVSPEKFMLEHANLCPVVHFKDMCVKFEEDNVVQRNVEITDGNMDYGAIYGACVKAGVEYAAVEQEENYFGNDPFKSLEVSLKNMKSRGMFTE